MYDENKPEEIKIIGWKWRSYISKADGKRGIICEFFSVDNRIIPMFLAIETENKKAKYAITANLKKFKYIVEGDNLYHVFLNSGLGDMINIDNINKFISKCAIYHVPVPISVTVKKDGNFYNFLKINY
jgi:hypothetical protein